MLLGTLIIAIILVAFVMLALGVKLLFDKNAEFTVHSCALEDDESLDKDLSCSKCQLRDLVDCPENKGKENIEIEEKPSK
ncbi:hypothetical protein [Mangrovibacterium lignilyticum]|uniref:hypothetical protein n=1 Tax=Mangrovibacterium lignilyticum TaxID=2668052 RepID=UPI0013D5E0C5|nr:hypothetical protein [Mangrovibacterium lignilyticum]